jgi:hypothetical protein
MKKIYLLLIIACVCSCGFESPIERAERVKAERESDSIISLEREKIKTDSINRIDKENKVFELRRAGKELDAMLLSGTISYEDYIALKKLDEKYPRPLEIDTSPTISEQNRDKIKRNLGTNPHLTH